MFLREMERKGFDSTSLEVSLINNHTKEIRTSLQVLVWNRGLGGGLTVDIMK